MLKILGKFFIIAGIFAIATGIILKQAGRFKWIGKLPGDILIQKGNFTFYFPLITCLLVSFFLSLLLFLIFKFILK